MIEIIAVALASGWVMFCLGYYRGKDQARKTADPVELHFVNIPADIDAKELAEIVSRHLMRKVVQS